MPITLFTNGTVKLTDVAGSLATGVLLLDSAGVPLVIGGAGGTSSTDTGGFTAGASSITPTGGYVGNDAVAAGKVGAFRMLGGRQQVVTLFDSAGNEITTLPVSLVSVPSHAVTNAGTFATQPGPTTAGGLSSYSALSTSAVLTAQIKGSAGQFYEIEIFNKGAAAVYARLYDQTGAPASTDGANIVWRGIVPGATTGAGFVRLASNGRVCATGIGIRVSGAIADNDTTVLNANEVTVNVGYK